MKRICFVVHRYGLEVNGGAELQCRLFAEHLNCEEYRVEVATTKAIDYMTWEDKYDADEETINGILVHRFSVDSPRDIKKFNKVNSKFLAGLLKSEKEDEFFIKQGPYCTKILSFIEKNSDYYDAFVFFGYLYYTTVMGLPIVKDKAILVPEAHDEPYMELNRIKQLFYSPKAFFFNTDEERDLVHNLFHNENIPSDIGGIGIDSTTVEEREVEEFKEKHKLDKYIIYVGRIDYGKNCDMLFKYFSEYKKRNNNGIKLVLMGKPVIPVPDEEDIVSLGFVSEEDKLRGVAGATALVLPSGFESLSMVILEAMSLKTMTIVNGESDVLRGHCTKSNGAFYYYNYWEFQSELNYVLTHDKEVALMTENAKEYVENNYRWTVLIDRLKRLINQI